MHRSIFHAVRNSLQDYDRKDNGAGGGGADNGADTSTRNDSVRTVKSIADAEAELRKLHETLSGFVTKASGEIRDAGKISTETKAAVDSLLTKMGDTADRLDKLEAKYDRQGEGKNLIVSPGKIFIDSDDYKGMSRGAKVARIDTKSLLGNMETKAIVNATGQNQPLVPSAYAGMITPQQRRMTVRDLLPVGRTVSNLVQYTVETLFTNNAGPQVAGSPTVGSENATKPESDITFALANAPVVTLAHFILVSKQVLDDAPMLESYINGRLMYGLKLEEEDELLNGDGGAGQINGLLNQAIAYNRSNAGTRIDMLRRAVTQIALSEFDAEFYVLNPVDWEEIELTKDSQGRYIIARPESLAPPRLWSKDVVATQAITPNYWLAGNGSQAAQIWDREQAGIELSREDGDNFKKNMVTILAEERLALTVYRPAALVKGQFV